MNEADTMQQVIVPVIPTDECRDAYYKKMEEDSRTKIYLDRNICAGGTEGTYYFILFY